VLERDVCERVSRQLQCVGDALAWKAFGYQRNFILVLSRNAPPGPMAGKAVWKPSGVPHRRLARRGRFALLHDLTSCLRIGDVTIFDADRVHLHEIKTSERHRTRRSSSASTKPRGTA